jgi:hypothetical protein
VSSGAKAPRRFLRSPDLVSREIAGETVVVPICRGVGDLDSIFTFNSVGTHLWNVLAAVHTESELIKSITENFEVGDDVAQSDVRNFMTDLLEVGLVRTV